ncbi:MAG: hypothetical protein IJR02_14990 [Bacteroidaceae bacterium]|nr:hypothetical protein [Bacteroidaceae bacterium]
MYCPDELPGTNKLLIDKGTLGGFGSTLIFEGDTDISDDVVVGITTTNYTNFTNSDAWFTLDGSKFNEKFSRAGVY